MDGRYVGYIFIENTVKISFKNNICTILDNICYSIYNSKMSRDLFSIETRTNQDADAP